MQRAGQTTHGARPNRKGVRSLVLTDQGFGHVQARCVQPSGRSLEPRSNAWPRGMTVPLEQSGGQNSAYRFGCHTSFIFIFSILEPAPTGFTRWSRWDLAAWLWRCRRRRRWCRCCAAWLDHADRTRSRHLDSTGLLHSDPESRSGIRLFRDTPCPGCRTQTGNRASGAVPR